MPAEVRYLWLAFNRLANQRGSNGYGFNPLGWSEIDAFLRLNKMKMTPWEIETIEMLDSVYLTENRKANGDE